MDEFYYVCLPNRDNVLDIDSLEPKYQILLKDVTSLYVTTYPKWSCGLVYLVIGKRESIIKFLRENYFYVTDVEDYSKFFKEFQM